MTLPVWLLTLPLAADPVPEPEDVRPGWIALITVLLLIAASTFLWFSMRKQIRRIRVPEDDQDAQRAPEDAPTEPEGR